MKTTLIALLTAGSLFAASSSSAADAATQLLINRLGSARHSLASAIAQAEKEYGPAISAKFEMKDDRLMLSVYTARGGLTADAEHNVLIELLGDATQDAWTPEVEVFEDKAHLTRAAMQLSLVQLSSLSLSDAIKQAETQHAGTVYSVIPEIRDGKVRFDVKVAAPEGVCLSYSVDGITGATNKRAPKNTAAGQ